MSDRATREAIGVSPGALGWLAATLPRLVTATALALGLWAGLTYIMAGFIREDATSNASVMMLLVGYAFVGLAAAFGLAGLIGDRVFSSGWRLRFLVGVRVAAPVDSSLLVVPKNHVLAFSALVVTAVIGLGFMSEAMTGGVLADYQFSGSRRVTLRGDDVESKHEVLLKLGEERREERVMAAIELIDVVWRDPAQSDVTRRLALAALGELVDYLNSAIDTWRIEGKTGRWQESFAVSLRARLAPEVRSARRAASGWLRADLTRLLGLLRDVDSEREFVDSLARSTPQAEPAAGLSGEWLATVQALIEIRTLGSLTAIGQEARRLEARGVTVPEAAFDLLALGTAKLAHAYHFARPLLDPRSIPPAELATLSQLVVSWTAELKHTNPRRRCAAAIVLMRLRHGEALMPLLAAFDHPTAHDLRCETEIVDLGLGRGEALGAGILLRRRLLDAIGALSGGNKDVAAWLDRHLKAKDVEAEVEAVLVDLRGRLFE